MNDPNVNTYWDGDVFVKTNILSPSKSKVTWIEFIADDPPISMSTIKRMTSESPVAEKTSAEKNN